MACTLNCNVKRHLVSQSTVLNNSRATPAAVPPQQPALEEKKCNSITKDVCWRWWKDEPSIFWTYHWIQHTTVYFSVKMTVSKKITCYLLIGKSKNHGLLDKQKDSFTHTELNLRIRCVMQYTSFVNSLKYDWMHLHQYLMTISELEKKFFIC